MLLTISMSNIAYAQTPPKTIPYGPKISDLQNKEDILNSLDQIKTIRANLVVIAIKQNTPVEELRNIDNSLQRDIDQLRRIRTNLVNHADKYGN